MTLMKTSTIRGMVRFHQGIPGSANTGRFQYTAAYSPAKRRASVRSLP
jgi:hypothetical protein